MNSVGASRCLTGPRAPCRWRLYFGCKWTKTIVDNCFLTLRNLCSPFSANKMTEQPFQGANCVVAQGRVATPSMRLSVGIHRKSALSLIYDSIGFIQSYFWRLVLSGSRKSAQGLFKKKKKKSASCVLQLNGTPSIAVANQISSRRCQGHPAGLGLSCDWIITHESGEDLTNPRDQWQRK